MMSLTHDELLDLRTGRLEVDALHMKLRHRGTDAVAYEGPGQIRLTQDGTLEYVLFDSGAGDGFGWDSLPVPGSWVASDSLLDLSVQDWRGRNWSAQRTRPDTSHVDGKPGVVCRGELREITLTSDGSGPAGEFISLFARFEGDIPYNLITRIETDAGGRKSYSFKYNVWEVDGANYTVRVTQADDGLEIEASRPAGVFPAHFDTRLLEGLWFVLAKPIEWYYRIRVNQETHSLTIRRQPPPPPSPRLRPPLEFRLDSDAAEPCGRMLLRYLEYVEPYLEPRFHPMSVNVRQTLLASATNIETEALALGIAVESLIRREYKQYGKPGVAFISVLGAAMEFWDKWTGPSDVKERIRRAIENMRGTNPREAMNKLVDLGILSPEHRSSWNKLRHTTAHGLDFEADFRQVVNWCDSTHAALLRLIFVRIGYTGPYTDRSATGWPTIMYP
jgi:hypothetical protein